MACFAFVASQIVDSIMDDIDAVPSPEPTESDDGENDCEGFFLEHAACSISMEERIAEANRQLFEESGGKPQENEDGEEKPRKVQFSEDVDYAPEENLDFPDSDYSALSEEPSEEFDCSRPEGLNVNEDLERAIEIPESSPDYPDQTEEESKNPELEESTIEEKKILLVLLPREQYSSTESLLEEEPIQEKEPKEVIKEVKEKSEPKVRPKSASRSSNSRRSEKIECKMMTVSPELNYSSDFDSRGWKESPLVKVKQRPKSEVRPSIDYKTEDRPMSGRESSRPVLRPKSGPQKRPCCPVRSDLPRYNGLRSEYGLSAEQLQQRKQQNAAQKQKTKEEEKQKLEHEAEKRQENEQRFNLWLSEKATATSRSKQSISRPKIDTLTRSDSFIQKHAVYASKCGVPYAVSYRLANAKKLKKKNIDVGKMVRGVAPQGQVTYHIMV